MQCMMYLTRLPTNSFRARCLFYLTTLMLLFISLTIRHTDALRQISMIVPLAIHKRNISDRKEFVNVFIGPAIKHYLK